MPKGPDSLNRKADVIGNAALPDMKWTYLKLATGLIALVTAGLEFSGGHGSSLLHGMTLLTGILVLTETALTWPRRR
jgi:hypothetical protein